MFAKPSPTAKQFGVHAGSWLVLSKKRPFPLMLVNEGLNGGLLPPICSGHKRSRLKNWPTPARMAHLPLPVGSHAIPRRGAIVWLLLFISARLGPATPPLPVPHGFEPNPGE